MGDVISGKNMAVNSDTGTGIYHFRIYQKHYPPWMVGGNQLGAVARELGNTDWGGDVWGNGHTPVILPNDSFSFECAPAQSGSIGVSGTARCLAVEIVVDNRNPEDPQPIWWHARFGANGTALTTGATAPTDTSVPKLYPPKGLCAYFGSSQIRTKYQRLFLFARGVVATVDCTSDGVFLRTEGEIDGDLTWIVNTNDSSDFLDEASGEQRTRMYVTATDYWQVDWMEIVDTPDPWEANRREPRDPVQATFKAAFTGHSGTTDGSITQPDGTEWWPTDGRS